MRVPLASAKVTLIGRLRDCSAMEDSADEVVGGLVHEQVIQNGFAG